MSAEFDLENLPDAPDQVAPPAFDLESMPDSVPVPEPVSMTAFKGAAGDATAAPAILSLSRRTGFAPQFVADNLVEVRQRTERDDYATLLRTSPTVAEWAAQSPVHAAAAKEDVGILAALEQGFADIGYGEFATAQMTAPTQFGEDALRTYEEQAAEYEKKHSGLLADFSRSLPSLGLYFLGDKLGHLAGGTAGGAAASGGLMFGLNRGVLYRRIMQQMPIPESDADGVYDPEAYEQRARTYATVGAGVSAALGAGLSTAVSLALPGAARKVQDLSNGLLTRAFTDAATRDVVARLVDAGGHTAWGALMMAVPAVTDNATVQKAVTGRIDVGMAAESGWEVFKGALLAAGFLSALPHAKPLVDDLGRIHQAAIDKNRLYLQVQQAKASKLVQQAPGEAAPLIDKMAASGDSATVYIDHDAAADPAMAQKLVEALADDGAALAEAQATQSDVAVPVGTYLTKFGDQHDAIADSVRLSAEGLSPKRAEELRRELDGWQKYLTADHNAATGETRPLPELAAEKYGGTPEQWALALNPPKTVFRVENAEGHGPYNPDMPTELRQKLAAVYPADEHPRPTGSSDFGAVPKDLVFGFPSRDAAEAWFGKDGLRVLAENGYPLKEFPAKDVKIGVSGAQVLFSALRVADPQAPRALPSRDLADFAAASIDARRIDEIQPGRYELAAKRAADQLATVAKEGAERGTSAARTGFLAAGMSSLDSAPPEAGKENMRAAARGADVADRRLAKLPDLERARDLARAIAARATEVREEMGSARKYLDSRDTPESIALLAKAGPEYEAAWHAILDAVGNNGLRPKPNGAALDALLARMERDAEPVGFDADQLRAVLEQPRGWKALTPPEARNVLDAAKNLRAAARRANEVALSDRRQSLRDMVADVRAHLDETGVPDKGLPPPSRASESFPERIGNRGGAMLAELLQPREILRRLGPAGDAVYGAFVGARNARDELARQVGDHFYRAYELGMPKELKKIRFDGVDAPAVQVPLRAVVRDTWTRQDLWNLAAWMGNESNAQRAVDGLHTTPEAVREALSQLSGAEWDFIESIWRLNDEKLWPLISNHAKTVTGTTPPKIEARPFTVRTAEGDVRTVSGGYWPARYNADISTTPVRATSPEGDGTISGYFGNLRDGFSGTATYFTKERAQQYTAGPDLNWSMYAGHVNSVLQYLAFDDFVRNAGRVFTDGEFRELVKRRLGGQEMRELDKFLSVAARGNVDAAQNGAHNWGQVIGGAFRSRVATAAFGLNIPVVLGQLSHIPAAMFGLRIAPWDMTSALALTLYPETWRTAHEQSAQLSYRWNGYGSKMREMLADIGPGERVGWRKWIDAASWSTYHVMDGFLSKTIWEAAAAKSERGGATAEAAAKAGDAAVAAMMPPLNIAEQSSIARDRGLIGSLILVRNFPNVLYNVGAMNAWQARTQVWQADPGLQRLLTGTRASVVAAGSYLGMVLSAHIFGRFLMGHGRQDDETTDQWLEREALAAPFYPVPFAQDPATLIAEAITSEKKLNQVFAKHGIAAAPSIAALEGAIRDIGKVLDEDQPDTDRIFAGAKLAATALRLPVYPLRPMHYAVDLALGDQDPRGPFDVAGGLLYGQRRRQARNPLTVAQDLISGD